MQDAAQKCVDDITEVLQSIAKIKGNIVQVYSESELLDKSRPISKLTCGVTYEGMRAIAEPGATAKMGVSSELVLSVILVAPLSALSSANTKFEATPVLDAIRNQMVGRRSPTGHFWRFVVEAAAQPANGKVLWVQRWTTPVQLTG